VIRIVLPLWSPSDIRRGGAQGNASSSGRIGVSPKEKEKETGKLPGGETGRRKPTLQQGELRSPSHHDIRKKVEKTTR
jgi:hypothetical protein